MNHQWLKLVVLLTLGLVISRVSIPLIKKVGWQIDIPIFNQF